MYAHLNTTHKLVVTKQAVGLRYKYEIVNKATGEVVYTKYAFRRFVAASTTGACFYGKVETVEKDKAFFARYPISPVYAYLEDITAFQDATASAYSVPL
jgi:hypothetical protein